jgi:hypothetical protein
MNVEQTARRGVAIMREFHSSEGIDEHVRWMLKSLEEVAAPALFEQPNRQKRALLRVLLKTAFQVGRTRRD